MFSVYCIKIIYSTEPDEGTTHGAAEKEKLNHYGGRLPEVFEHHLPIPRLLARVFHREHTCEGVPFVVSLILYLVVSFVATSKRVESLATGDDTGMPG